MVRRSYDCIAERPKSVFTVFSPRLATCVRTIRASDTEQFTGRALRSVARAHESQTCLQFVYSFSLISSPLFLLLFLPFHPFSPVSTSFFSIFLIFLLFCFPFSSFCPFPSFSLSLLFPFPPFPFPSFSLSVLFPFFSLGRCDNVL